MSDRTPRSSPSPRAEAQRLLAARGPSLRYRSLPNGRQVVDDGDDHERDSDHGYTTNPGVAMRNEPEAVTREVQDWLTREAKSRAIDRRREAWQQTRSRLQRERDYFASQLRARERELARLDRRLAGSA